MPLPTRPLDPRTTETRQRIIETSLRLFAEHGRKGVSVRHISAAAKVKIAAVSYHFGSKRSLALVLVALVGAAALAALALYRPVVATAGAESPRPALTVTLVTPVAADWPRVIEASGGLYAWQEGVIAAETGGLRVVEIAVEVGEQVRRGQELARLAQDTVQAELAQQEARVAQVRASLAEARANAERARTV